MMRWWPGLIICLAICLFSSLLLARPGVVHTRDGLTYDGDITETDNTVTVRTGGIATTIDRSNVAAIAYGENLAADIESRWKKLKPNDVSGRLELGREAFEARQYLLCRKILQETLDIDPNNRAAADLYDLARAQIDLDRKRIAATEPGAVSTAPVAAAPSPSPLLTNDRRFLSLADINNIREMEITSRDANIRLRIDPDVSKRFTIGTDTNLAEFRSRPLLDQYMAIRTSGKPDLLRGIRILSDPQTIIEFRRDIQPTTLAGCAAAHCHGAPSHPGNFQLLTEVGDAAVYTNFFNLASYAKSVPNAAGGIFGNGALRMMIDRSLPENSLILQYMLPPEVAAMPHPPLRNAEYRGVVKSKDDPRYQRIASWIANTLAPTEMQYNVAYKPPFLTAEVAPTIVTPAPAPAVPPIAPANTAAPTAPVSH